MDCIWNPHGIVLTSVSRFLAGPLGSQFCLDLTDNGARAITRLIHWEEKTYTKSLSS